MVSGNLASRFFASLLFLFQIGVNHLTSSQSLSTLRTFFASIVISASLIAVGIVVSVSMGVTDIRWTDTLYALFGEGVTKEQLIISTIRLPRALVAVMVGAGLAVAGALMQAVTRNPFASPQIFGINSGASFIVVLFIVFFPGLSATALVYTSFIGAALGALLVMALSFSAGQRTPVQLALAGIAVSMLLTSLTEGIIVLFDNQTQNVLFWLAGAVHGGTWTDVQVLYPWMAAGLFFAVLISKPVTLLSLGDDVATGLGQNVLLTRLFASAIVIVLAGSAVSVAGPIGFVGLVIPHIVRFLIGQDYRLIIPLSALFGANLLLYADVLSRFLAYPFESPVGIVTAAIGAPFFLWLLLRRRETS